jgi:hypothetical protein
MLSPNVVDATSAVHSPTRLNHCMSSIRRDVQLMEANCFEKNRECDELKDQLDNVGRIYRSVSVSSSLLAFSFVFCSTTPRG